MTSAKIARRGLRRALGFLLGACAAGVFAAAALAADGDVVQTAAGVLRGTVDSTGAMREFLGIPYAAPPVGDLRWRAPEPAPAWSDIREATRFGNHCPQSPTPFGIASTAEDCLFLNVFAPQGRGGKHPVMVWIHGGALVVGLSDDYIPTKLVEQGVVVVTLNYRLGVLGFLAHPALDAELPDHSSGNYGIMDQQLALRWVRDNIAAFGGDPGNVTIFGESAGGLSVLAQLASPGAKGLFQRAIVESGTYMLRPPTRDVAESRDTAAATSGKAIASKALELAAIPGCDAGNPTAACLRKVSVEQILQTQTALSPLGQPRFRVAPVVDGKVLTQTIEAALTSGRINGSALMIGTNHDEWRLFLSGLTVPEGQTGKFPMPAIGYGAGVNLTLGAILADSGNSNVPAAIAAVVKEYPSGKTPATANAALGALGTDAVMACPAHYAAELAARHIPVFAYEFDDAKAPDDFLPPLKLKDGTTLARNAYHAAELQYLFDRPFPPFLGAPLHLASIAPLSADQVKLADAMVGYWAIFAKTGGGKKGLGTPAWPHFAAASDAVQSLMPPQPVTITAQEKRRDFAAAHHCAFWNHWLHFAPITTAMRRAD